MPTKKKSCDLVHQGIAGPASDQILDAIKAEYWLPASIPQPAPSDAAEPSDQPIKPNTKPQVKP
ncbi:MAG TPA: hypothetical protein VJ822_13135 [Dongiaceae bacterium]|nr:hypothetical protein [Dongiaceae bacterium]